MASTFWLVASSTSDGGVEAVPDYRDVRGVPERAARQEASAALGWTIGATARGDSVRLSVTDRAGRPVAGLAGSVVVGRPHLAAPLDTVALAEAAPGTYPFALAAPAAGLWDFTFDASRGADRFVGTTRLSLP